MSSTGKIILMVAVVSALVAGSGYYISTKLSPPKEVHYHAGFKVYVDGKVQDFSRIQYMTISPCTDHATKKEVTAKEIQNDKGHLHDNVGDVVHVHRAGGTWGDLFTNIHFPFPEGKPVFTFVNGTPVEDILRTPIKAYDSIVIFIGKREDMKAQLKQAVTTDHIKEIEKKSELCGSGTN